MNPTQRMVAEKKTDEGWLPVWYDGPQLPPEMTSQSKMKEFRKITEVDELSSEEEMSVCEIRDFDSISDLEDSDYECLDNFRD